MSNVRDKHGHRRTLQELENPATPAHRIRYQLLLARRSKVCCHTQLVVREITNAFLWLTSNSALGPRTSNGLDQRLCTRFAHTTKHHGHGCLRGGCSGNHWLPVTERRVSY